MIKYKINVLEELNKKGYSTYRIKQDHLLSGQTITNLKVGKQVNLDSLGNICVMLRCQPRDVI